MNFSDIEPFTQAGGYEINVPLKRLEKALEDWKADYGLDLNPDFQRGHVWTEEQQIAFVEFLLRGGVTGRVIYFNSPAWGGTSERGDLDETILCVDGLQRLTACLRFMRDEIKVFGHKFSEFEGSPRMIHDLRLNVNDLKTRAEVLKWYIEFNSGGTVHSKEEIARVQQLLDDELKAKN